MPHGKSGRTTASRMVGRIGISACSGGLVHNGMLDRRPKLIVRAEQVADVIAAVNFARDNTLDLSVHGGGHSAPGFGTNDGGVVIDLCPPPALAA
jgi:hypothetical protein